DFSSTIDSAALSTPADPIFFRQFCAECDRHGRLAEMTQAGRSAPIIMEGANFMLEWLNQYYAFDPLPFRPQQIQPVPSDDPQPDANPAPMGYGLELQRPPTIVHTVALMAARIGQLFQANPEVRLAILVRENRQGEFVADCLRSPQLYNIPTDLEALGLEIFEVGERGRQSAIPGEMLDLLRFLERPHSPTYLKTVLQLLIRRQLIPAQDVDAIAAIPEAFLYPGPLENPATADVVAARRYCTKLLKARLELPPHQLIPFLALSLQYDQTELATADKLCDRLRQETAFEPSLTAVLAALTELTTTEQFSPVDTEQTEAQYTRPGHVTIITMHKAKGLDWDAVFLPFLHDKPFEARSWVPPQTQFLGTISLSDIAKAQIRHLVRTQVYPAGATLTHEDLAPEDLAPEDLAPENLAPDLHSQVAPSIPLDLFTLKTQANQQRIAEECRLLYVAMTRPKRLLWMAAAHQAPLTWRKPNSLTDSKPAPALIALMQKFPAAIV
ncbi:MAG: ATP-dependent helicase, partial [Cyanothece sp. SIO2G6]|nr:ATP-dependent helicase [Cyanothece sp. SIO2G6]